MVVLFGGLPGGVELLVVFLILALLVAPVVLLAVAYLFLRGRSTGRDPRGDLEARVADLEEEVAALRDEDGDE